MYKSDHVDLRDLKKKLLEHAGRLPSAGGNNVRAGSNQSRFGGSGQHRAAWRRVGRTF